MQAALEFLSACDSMILFWAINIIFFSEFLDYITVSYIICKCHKDGITLICVACSFRNVFMFFCLDRFIEENAHINEVPILVGTS